MQNVASIAPAAIAHTIVVELSAPTPEAVSVASTVALRGSLALRLEVLALELTGEENQDPTSFRSGVKHGLRLAAVILAGEE